MASRYSRIFLRPPKSTTISSESWGGGSSTTADPLSTESQAFSMSYPPGASSPSNHTDAMSPPRHPYTLAAAHSPVQAEFRDAHGLPGNTQQSTGNIATEKRPPTNPGPPHRRVSRQLRRASSLMPRPTPLRLRPVFLLLLFLPIPPLLAMLYMVTGHAILRAAQASPHSIYRAPILSSLEAGATGGVILALPLALLLYLLLGPNKAQDAPEDFFEDDSASGIMGQAFCLRAAGYALSVFFFVAIGGVSGPLGVTCLSSNAQPAFVGEKKMLSSSAAAAAGFVGGVVLASALVIVGALATLGWVWSRRPQAST